jgi:putative intracellular protease/amidase
MLFRDRPALPLPAPGPLCGQRVLVVVSPTECSGTDARTLSRRLHGLGAVVGLASECQGEARDERWRAVYTHRLLVEIDPADWDELVFAGGRGAARVARDQLALALAKAFAAAERVVAAVGRGREVLAHARIEGLRAGAADELVDRLARRLIAF